MTRQPDTCHPPNSTRARPRAWAGALVFAVLSVVAGIAWSRRARADDAPTVLPPSETVRTDPRVYAALRRPISVDVKPVPLKAALRRIAAAAGVPVTSNWDSDASDEASPAARVPLRFRRVPAGHVLMLTMRTLRLGPVVEAQGNGIHVGWDGPTGDQEADAVTATYRVVGRPRFGPDADDLMRDELDRWSSLVFHIVEPDSWRDNGGSLGTIQFKGPSLAVTTTPPIHREVADLLSQVWRAAAGPAPLVPTSAERAREALAAPVTFDLEATPVRDALARWQAAAGPNVFVDWVALAEEGFDLGVPVTVHTGRTTAAAALEAILVAVQGWGGRGVPPPRPDPAHPDAEAGRRPSIGYQVDREGVVWVSTWTVLARQTVVRCYNLARLIDRPSPLWPDGSTPDERAEVVKDKLIRDVASDTWRENGGMDGQMFFHAPVLVVVQNPAIQDQVAEALRAMR